MTRRRILEQNQRIIESIEDRTARDVAAAYGRARTELIARLLEAWRATDPSPSQLMRNTQTLGIIGEIDARIAALEEETGRILRNVVLSQDETALEAIRREYDIIQRFAGTDAARLSSVEFRLIEAYLPAVTDRLTLWSQNVRLTLRNELQTGLIQGESFDKLIDRVFTTSEPSTWRNGRNSAELMTRQSVIEANNMAKHAYIKQITAQVPQVRKQAVAVIAGNTTRTCLAVHGQIRDVDEPFTLTETPRHADEMMYSPFHWRCRTSTTTYHPIFEENGGLNTQEMRSAARSEINKR